MRVKQAKEVARQWVLEEAHGIPSFLGAFTHGSVNWLADDAVLPPASDVDILVVVTDPRPPAKTGKFIYRDVLLEVSYLTGDQVQSPECILGDYHLAGSFRMASILADPSGALTTLQAAVAQGYAKRRWVRARCEHARSNVLRYLQSLNEATLLHDQVMAWLFAAGVTTHVLLVTGLRNPTVRRRYVAARELLAGYGHAVFYASLLELLGCASMRRERVEQHLAALAEAFDAARAVIKTPFFFAADISEHARPVAIDGSREMIECDDHREAIFWMVVTYSRCQKVLYHDAPVELQERFRPGYQRLICDLGITSAADLQQRSAQVRAFLPRLWAVTEAILAANPGIEDEAGTRG